MNVSVVFVGIGQWEEYTEPLIKSLLKHQPDTRIIGVNNGMKYTGQQMIKYPIIWNNVWEEDYKPARYSMAMNAGIYMLTDEDWIVFINNDVLCTGPFIPHLEKMDKNTLYGNKIHYKFRVFEHETPFIDGWIMAISKKVIDDVGSFDENFERACAEDADYCFRAGKLGYKVEKSNLPFKHLEYRIRKTFPGYKEWRMRNIHYLMEKHNLKPRKK